MKHNYNITDCVSDEQLGIFVTSCSLRQVWDLLVKLYDKGNGIFAKEDKVESTL